MVTDVKISKPTFAHVSSATYRLPPGVTDDPVGVWFFNKQPGETNREAAWRCSRNRALGANTASNVRRWPGGEPTFFSGYARFREDQPLVTGVADPGAGLTMFVIARTLDTSIGSTSNHRGFVAGTYGGNNNNGFNFEFASYAAATARAIDYEDGGTIRTSTIDMGDSGDLDLWRIYQVESGTGGLQARNLDPGDGPTPAPNPTSLIGGRKTGTQTFTIGGRIPDGGNDYVPPVEKDIAAILLWADVTNGTERMAIANQLAFYAAGPSVGITMGSA